MGGETAPPPVQWLRGSTLNEHYVRIDRHIYRAITPLRWRVVRPLPPSPSRIATPKQNPHTPNEKVHPRASCMPSPLRHRSLRLLPAPALASSSSSPRVRQPFSNCGASRSPCRPIPILDMNTPARFSELRNSTLFSNTVCTKRVRIDPGSRISPAIPRAP